MKKHGRFFCDVCRVELNKEMMQVVSEWKHKEHYCSKHTKPPVDIPTTHFDSPDNPYDGLANY